MAVTAWCALLAFALAAQSAAMRASVSRAGSKRANPIRKVVKMLQTMENTIKKEGEEGEKLFKKYTCYCSSEGNVLKDGIKAAEEKIPALGSDIEAGEKDKALLDEAVPKAASEREAAKTSMFNAKEVREKEAVEFTETKGEYKTNIAAVKKAVAALRANAYGGFLQTGAAATLRDVLTNHGQLLDDAAIDMPELFSFLSGTEKQDARYAPQTGEVIGILDQFADQMAFNLNDTVDAEEKAIAGYQALMDAKGKVVTVLTEQIARKMSHSADLGVSIANMKNDLEAIQAALEFDKKFLQDLDSTCASKTSEWKESMQTRTEELEAIAETIKTLNDDDSIELFKSALPSAAMSFLQVDDAGTAKARALRILRKGAKGGHGGMQRLDFIGLALRGSTVGVDKVIKMLGAMVRVIEEEQTADETKKVYCDKQTVAAEDKMKRLTSTSSNIATAIANSEEAFAAVKEKIAELTNGLAALDQEVADASEQRKEEHANYFTVTHDNTAAKQLLSVAINHLRKFYTPQLHTTIPSLSEPEVQTYSAFVGTSFAQVAMMTGRSSTSAMAVTAAPAPEGPDAYAKKTEESTGVIAMIGQLMKDLDAHITKAEANEIHDQETYEGLIKDSTMKKAAATKEVTEAQVVKSEMEVALQSQRRNQEATKKDSLGVEQFTAQLQTECSWLRQYFQARTDARKSEIDAIGSATAVLSGADYSLL